jgi:hypothetical protein
MKAMIIKHPDSNLSYLIVPTSVSVGSGTQKYLSGFSPLANDQSESDHIRWKIYRDRNMEVNRTIRSYGLANNLSKLKSHTVVIPLSASEKLAETMDSEIVFKGRVDPIVDCS